MTNPLIPYAGDLYTGGVKAQTFTIPAAQSASYWTAADSTAVSGIIADIINNGTVALSTTLGSISGAFSSTIGSVSGAFSSTIGSVSGAFSSTIGSVSGAFSSTIGSVSGAFSSTIATMSASLTAVSSTVDALVITGAPPGVAWLTSSDFTPAGGQMGVSGLIATTDPVGLVVVGSAGELGVTISASGMSSYTGIVATNPSGSAFEVTINPNNGSILFNLGHAATDGGTDASTIQVTTNNGFVNSGGPTVMGQHASQPLRIYGTSGLAFGTTATDVCQVTGVLHLNDIIRLKSVASSTRADGDIWRDGEKFYFFMTGTRYEINLTAAP